MKKLIWRIKFMFAVHKIFSKPKSAFTANNFKLGWRVSGRVYRDYEGMDPWHAAVNEISDWYSL